MLLKLSLSNEGKLSFQSLERREERMKLNEHAKTTL